MTDNAEFDSHVHLDATQLWHGVLSDLEHRLPRASFENWVRDTSLVAFADDQATIAARGTGVVAILESRVLRRYRTRGSGKRSPKKGSRDER